MRVMVAEPLTKNGENDIERTRRASFQRLRHVQGLNHLSRRDQSMTLNLPTLRTEMLLLDARNIQCALLTHLSVRRLGTLKSLLV